ncbi:MAG: hypothetical protein IJ640_09510 [Prevotella sp.]|nr:hypothetical protein [Prevotella sp.]
MKVRIEVKQETTMDVRFVKIDAGVRYWEDGEVNGKDDIDLYETKGVCSPTMPFAIKVKDAPTSNIYSDHYRWQPIIDIEKGCIVGWPKGTSAKVHYKVCDDGIYYLLAPDYKQLYKIESYVPSFLGEEGDYIIMDIDKDGNIAKFSCNEDDIKELIENGF